MQFKRSPADAEAALTLSTTGTQPKIVVLSGTQGAFRVKKTLITLKPGTYYFDVQVNLGPDDVYVIIVGKIEIYATAISD